MNKIAIVQTNLNIGGIEKSLINFLNNIDYRKNEVDLYLFNKGELFSELPKKVNVILLDCPNKKKILLGFKINKMLYKPNITKEYDVAIDFNGYDLYTAICCLNIQAKKHIIWVHNDYLLKYKHEYKFKVLYQINKNKYHLFDEIVCVSNKVKQSFIKMTNVISKYRVIPNYINTKNIVKLSKQKNDLKVDNKKVNFVCLGRLVYQKGYDDLLIKYKEVVKRRKDTHLYFIGDGILKEKLLSLVETLELKEYVTFLGSKDNPYTYLKEMDTLVFNSRYEGQGMVVLEALTLGLNIILKKELEQYLDNIKGTNDIVSAMINEQKHDKKIDMLEDYNNRIKKSIEDMIGEK